MMGMWKVMTEAGIGNAYSVDRISKDPGGDGMNIHLSFIDNHIQAYVNNLKTELKEDPEEDEYWLPE